MMDQGEYSYLSTARSTEGAFIQYDSADRSIRLAFVTLPYQSVPTSARTGVTTFVAG